MQLLTISEAASVAGKSIQTIRRMIKQKKIRVQRQKTPQGFNYLIVKDSLLSERSMQTVSGSQTSEREHRSLLSDVGQFNTTIQRLIEQHEKDKEQFFSLIKTFQERNLMLENKIKMLESPKPKWWQLWK